MKPEDVRFHHIRDWPWPTTFCPKCGRVPTFHKHWGLAEIPAIPTVVEDTTP